MLVTKPRISPSPSPSCILILMYYRHKGKIRQIVNPLVFKERVGAWSSYLSSSLTRTVVWSRSSEPELNARMGVRRKINGNSIRRDRCLKSYD